MEAYSFSGHNDLTTEDYLRMVSGGDLSKEAVKDLSVLPLNRMLNITPNELMTSYGISKDTSQKLWSAFSFFKHLSQQKDAPMPFIASPRDIFSAFSYLSYEEQEQLIVVSLRSSGKIIRSKKIFIGAADSCHLHVREILKEVILNSATTFVVIHNHPSGRLTPSDHDVSLTKDLSQASELLRIPLWDHVIIGDGDYLSMKDKGYF